jgi:hypothetical protein
MPSARADKPHEEVVERAGTVPLMNGTDPSLFYMVTKTWYPTEPDFSLRSTLPFHMRPAQPSPAVQDTLALANAHVELHHHHVKCVPALAW